MYFPLKENGSSAFHDRWISSRASWKRSRSSIGGTPYTNAVSIEVPKTIPAIMRPPERQSSMAISSATRSGGLYRASELPHRAIAEFSVVAARMAAMRLGEGVMAIDV